MAAMGIAIRPRMLNRKTYNTFDGRGSLPGLCIELLSEQKRTWWDLREGYESLTKIKERNLNCRGFSVRLQYNPGRIKSSTALAAETNATGRQCFLCLDHLPEGQKGILYRSEYLILCNPMPVFSSHFTVSHIDHRLQAIGDHIGTFLQLMADFDSGWMVLYNGPKCGASAPDHLHFQAVPSGQMPIENEIREKKRLALVKTFDNALFSCVRELGREVILLEGDDPMAVENALQDYLNGLKKALLVNEEPMINMAGLYEGKRWRLVIFPRRKHRPDVFFKDGEARMVISPGAIDMGGVLITPVEKDFERLDETAVEGIYKEVSLEGEIVERAVDAMR